MISNEQVAHDLALAYVLNRYGPNVTGEFDVSTFERVVSGSGTVETERLPDLDEMEVVRTDTGDKRLFGLVAKTKLTETGNFAIDAVFLKMIDDYRGAFERLFELLEGTRVSPDSAV